MKKKKSILKTPLNKTGAEHWGVGELSWVTTTTVHKCNSAFRPDRNHRMTKTYHRVAFVDLICFTGGLAAVLTAHGHTSYCQTYAYLCDTHIHFSNQHLFVIVKKKKTRLLEIVASVAQNLSFRMYRGCVTFELGLKITQSPQCWLLHCLLWQVRHIREAAEDLRWLWTWGHIGSLITRSIPGLTR